MILINLIVLVFLEIVTIRAQFPPVPCPQNFKYEWDGQNYYGKVTIYDFYDQEIMLEVKLTQNFPVAKLGNYGQIAFDQDNSNFQKGCFVYRIDFPYQNEFPTLKSIIVNGTIICQTNNPEVSRARQTISLFHSLRYSLPKTTTITNYENKTTTNVFLRESHENFQHVYQRTVTVQQPGGQQSANQQPQFQQPPLQLPLLPLPSLQLQSLQLPAHQQSALPQSTIQYSPSQPNSQSSYMQSSYHRSTIQTVQTPGHSVYNTQQNPIQPINQQTVNYSPNTIDQPTSSYGRRASIEPATQKPPVQQRGATYVRREPVAQPTAAPGIIRTHSLQQSTTTTTTPRPVENVSNAPNVCNLIQRASETSNDLPMNTKFPWVAGIFRKGILGLNFTCDGSLISANTVVTSAECLDFNNVSPDNAVVFLGWNPLEYTNDSEVVIREAERIIVHPDFYRNATQNEDIALMHLKKPIDFTQNIHPICLYSDFKSNKKQNVR